MWTTKEIFNIDTVEKNSIKLDFYFSYFSQTLITHFKNESGQVILLKNIKYIS